jgi:hypothetical protein
MAALVFLMLTDIVANAFNFTPDQIAKQVKSLNIFDKKVFASKLF